MSHRLIRFGAPVLAAALLTSACSGRSSGHKTTAAPSANIQADQVSTPDAKGDLDSLTWSGDYRPPYSLDPLKTADYPEETILTNVCTPLLNVTPDYRLQPGIASAWKQVDGTHLTFDIDPKAHFSDGKPVTADDVVFSLKRNMDPQQASNYADSYTTVSDIAASGPDQVTVTMNTANYVFVRSMGILAGSIMEKSSTEAAGQNFGTAEAKPVCAGPYTVDSFDGTNTLVLKKDPNYWDTAHAAKAGKITFQFLQDPKAFATALDQGTVQGAFDVNASLVGTLSKSAAGKLWIGGEGSSTQNIDLIISKLDGNAGNARVRQALSMAIDRVGIAQTIFAGAADPLYSPAGPGYFLHAPDAAKAIYQAAYDKLKSSPDIATATKLVTDAGAKGKTITIAYPADGSTQAQLAQVLQQTGTAIGLDVKIVALPLQQYGDLFTDPKARDAYDGFLTINYLEFPEAQAMLGTYGMKEGIQNFNGYSDPTVEDDLNKAQATEDPAARAQFVVAAQAKLAQDLPWIPIVAPRLALFQNKAVTGAPLTFSFVSSAWAAAVGSP